MMLLDLLSPSSVVVPLAAADREAAIAGLVDALGLDGGPPERERLRAAILAREAAGSTGIGNGVAIPHARTSRIKAPRLAVGRTAQPIDFKAADGAPVSLVFLLAVPESDPRSHLRVLAALSALALDKKKLKGLQKAGSAAEARAALSAIAV